MRCVAAAAAIDNMVEAIQQALHTQRRCISSHGPLKKGRKEGMGGKRGMKKGMKQKNR